MGGHLENRYFRMRGIVRSNKRRWRKAATSVFTGCGKGGGVYGIAYIGGVCVKMVG